jgi:chromosome segregation ATPase
MSFPKHEERLRTMPPIDRLKNLFKQYRRKQMIMQTRVKELLDDFNDAKVLAERMQFELGCVEASLEVKQLHVERLQEQNEELKSRAAECDGSIWPKQHEAEKDSEATEEMEHRHPSPVPIRPDEKEEAVVHFTREEEVNPWQWMP